MMHKKSNIDMARTEDDKLGYTIRFMRAAEKIDMFAMEKCIAAYPHLGSLVNSRDPSFRNKEGLATVRAHALELARAGTTLVGVHRCGWNGTPNGVVLIWLSQRHGLLDDATPSLHCISVCV